MTNDMGGHRDMLKWLSVQKIKRRKKFAPFFWIILVLRLVIHQKRLEQAFPTHAKAWPTDHLQLAHHYH